MQPWTISRGKGPIVAAAIHHGHDLRPEVRQHMALSRRQRRREEDAFTAEWTSVAATKVVVWRSRFEMDLNRPPNNCVYLEPENAWGLEVWKSPLPQSTIDRSRQLYQQFYRQMHRLLSECIDRHGRVIVLDLHDYNHRRDGPDAPCAPPSENPEINIGTGSMPREQWAPVVETFINGLRQKKYLGRQLDVRENVRFQGGFFPQWIHETFPEHACALAIEIKKFFMDEWTGRADRRSIEVVRQALEIAVARIDKVHPRGRLPRVRWHVPHVVSAT